MASVGLLDRAGRRRSQATLSGFHQGRQHPRAVLTQPQRVVAEAVAQPAVV